MTSENDKYDLLKYPNYLLSTYQLEIYRQLGIYMEKNNLKKKDMAKKLEVSNSYISQVLKGQFNFTLKKLIELGLAINKIPYLEFIEADEYWRREKEGTIQYVVQTHTFQVEFEGELIPNSTSWDIAGMVIDYQGGKLPKSVTKTQELVK